MKWQTAEFLEKNTKQITKISNVIAVIFQGWYHEVLTTELIIIYYWRLMPMSGPWGGYTRWRTVKTNIRWYNCTICPPFFYFQIYARKIRKGNPEWTIQRHKWHWAKTLNEETVYGLCCLTPLSTIFQLYRGEEAKKKQNKHTNKNKKTRSPSKNQGKKPSD